MTSPSRTPHDVRLVLTTCDSEAQATALARQLLEERLVACVSVVPVISHYRWEGELRQEPEVQLLLKTSLATLQPLLEHLERNHPYDVPERLVLPADAVGAYGRWLLAELRRV